MIDKRNPPPPPEGPPCRVLGHQNWREILINEISVIAFGAYVVIPLQVNQIRIITSFFDSIF